MSNTRFCQERPFGNLVLFLIPFYLRLNFELELNETQAMVFECMYESSPKSPERMRPVNSMKGFSAFQPPTRIHRSREPLSCSVQTQTTMAALVLALILFPCLSSATEQGHQALCGRVDGQAAPEDVQALLHHTLPLALPWDQAWLGSLQVRFTQPSTLAKFSIARSSPWARFRPTSPPLLCAGRPPWRPAAAVHLLGRTSPLLLPRSMASLCT